MSSSVVERPSAGSGATPEKRVITTKPGLSDRIFLRLVTAGGLSSLVILGLIMFFLLYQGYSTLKSQGSHFLTASEWTTAMKADGSVDLSQSHFGIAAMLTGTLVCAFIAVLIAVPISFFTAIFVTFYASEGIKKIMTSVIDLMAAFPSVLYGLWGFFVLMPHVVYWAKLLHKYFGWVPFFKMQAPFYDRSPFVAGVVLAVMVIPIMTSISREVFGQTPPDRMQAAYALGSTRWGMIRTIAVPYSRSGVIGGAMLGLGRAMGETVAIYTVLNLVYKINFHVLLGAGGNVASMILVKIGEATITETRALMAAGLILFAITLVINSAADLLVNRTGKGGR